MQISRRLVVRGTAISALAATGVLLSSTRKDHAAHADTNSIRESHYQPQLALVEKTASIREHRTGLLFHVVRGGIDRLPAADGDAYLLGANVRCMLGLCRLPLARAYAFGLYADADALASACSRSAATPASLELGENALPAAAVDGAQCLRDVLEAKAKGSATAGELSIVLIMARDIAGEHLAHGFKNSVVARARSRSAKTGTSSVATAASTSLASTPLALATGRASLEGASGSAAQRPVIALQEVVPGATPGVELATFCAQFHGHAFRVGDELTFIWKRGTAGVVASANGVSIAHLRDMGLCAALFDVYAGAAPVSERAKHTFEANLAAIAAQGIVAPPVTTRAVAGDRTFTGLSRADEVVARAEVVAARAAAAARDALAHVLPSGMVEKLPFLSDAASRLSGPREHADASARTAAGRVGARSGRDGPAVDAGKLAQLVAAEHAGRDK